MLKRVDRVQLAVRDRREAALTFADVLGAETVQEDDLRLFGATRTIVQAGESEFELLEPAGDGAVAEQLERWGEGIFAGGFSTDDPSGLARHMTERGLRFTEEGGQMFVAPEQTRGMRMVITRSSEREPVGLMSSLYEVTNIVEDHEEAASFYAAAFGLDRSRFSPIKSEQWGYTGTLTLFDPPARLDRIELTQITEPSLAMGRFFARRGPSIYMCYVETDNTAPIRERLEARGARYTAGREDGGGNLFIHPTALHGMLMGVSRKNLAWTWSGRPELARAGASGQS
jgi:catechol 2,3-dioxygenase-like lactoylglutathione lyase family enzyme